ncbi:hypothetical protein [Pisciglobus halotolerans]|uniref:CopG family transcriptional regulator / antitoxin EndoAI n=1 Tax=Pisciglobus halotolerans TaxID=745365 RepID=A0A1I3DZX5_9LACT|nr:hypothetical protein [Pisciglobus halotolerans]SFH92245.1 CopG family transcriptional regulator / antitoxin EndoAI [Pisciglobus halotolerans]
MSNRETKTVEVELELEVYEDIANYCTFFDMDQEVFMNEMMQHIIKEKLNIIDTMRKGYAEMSRINLDICHEFEVCEKEVSTLF